MASISERTVLEVDAVNPMGTDGFEFVEYTAPDPAALGALFESMGFARVARHRSKDVSLYRQGDVNFIVNAEPESFAQGFARVHGPSVCAIAFRVKNAARAYKRALSLGAWGVENKVGPMELNIPAIKGIGDSLIYLVDRYGERGSIYDVDFEFLPGVEHNPEGRRPHLYRPPDAQRASRPHGRMGGVLRAALQFPRDPLLRHRRQADRAEVEGDDQPVRQDPHPDQREHRRQVADPGISLAPITARASSTSRSAPATSTRRSRRCKTQGRAVPDRPDTYYEQVDKRLPGHGEDLARLAADRILIDGAPTEGGGLLLQIFTQTVIGPIFFEIIQRQGNEGFGEGNFHALFESIELDQIRRGVLKA